MEKGRVLYIILMLVHAERQRRSSFSFDSDVDGFVKFALFQWKAEKQKQQQKKKKKDIVRGKNEGWKFLSQPVFFPPLRLLGAPDLRAANEPPRRLVLTPQRKEINGK